MNPETAVFQAADKSHSIC